ncbi:hypothetical protein [Actinoplanes sp. NPDC051851]|uniref:hypothetical protein n=1 Tax=Actinoplanes sp. NPDC051851 TaxID=3154753 RepID=UPI00342F1CCA
MTNGMTAAGLAFIAGGLATLITFRAFLFGGDRRDDRAADPEHGERPPEERRRTRRPRTGSDLASIGLADDHRQHDEFALPAADENWLTGPAEEPAHPEPAHPEPARHEEPAHPEPARHAEPVHYEEAWYHEDHAATAYAPAPGPAREDPYQERSREIAWSQPPAAGPVALVYGEAPAEPYREAPAGPYREAPAEPYETAPAELYETAPAEPARPAERQADRVDGWVRPDYRALDDLPLTGEYWMPVPEHLYHDPDPEPSARGYGWPVPVERLPQVPDYEPATGFDLSPGQAAEPTAYVRDWRPAPEDTDYRIRLPRSWADRDEDGGRAPRPRPRPRPVLPPDPDDYVSRHSTHRRP